MAHQMTLAGAEIPAILTRRQAADYICCTPRYLENQIRLGRLKALRPTGKLVRIRRSDLEAFLESFFMPLLARVEITAKAIDSFPAMGSRRRKTIRMISA
jgi:excisionase family DNA binding protein